ncbi:MAG: hypothetical protein IM333_01275 [Microcystis sp. M048S1]|uniref:Uncharacterized protein n=1 Tax=Microcystis aeruginosa 11-30S32 TaxID=2358142 RepID=A0A510PJW2_MICAE|nr:MULTISPECIES: hypothetical protein [Microcystis]MCA2727635.1 hypothetical protein [Microcystis sp. M166S2]MCA2891647.1 hypothetical protein [Microcystis sp. M048S1]NCR31400.1 hypothetical protein [Microcystis aeruginosa L211-101]NCR78683.1 hypothetical protein [Microcystis aeruginosa K13-10]NCR83374.1 hypothetical protein [Microcystis aeruginosa K13-05]TRT69047.1 MAG: hypothetical protein EWV68_09690 [Microcystis sp. M_QC_C_20170808_M9Col]
MIRLLRDGNYWFDRFTVRKNPVYTVISDDLFRVRLEERSRFWRSPSTLTQVFRMLFLARFELPISGSKLALSQAWSRELL